MARNKSTSRPQKLTAEQALARAAAAARQGGFGEAIRVYHSILQRQPRHPVAKTNLTALEQSLPKILMGLYSSGQLEQAERTCRELLPIYPKSLMVLNVLGAALKGQGKLPEALQVFDKAIRLKPDYADAHSNRGAVLRELGRLDEAVRSFSKAVRLKPDYADAYSNLGVTLQELGRPEEALESLDKAIRLQPDHAEAYYNRGNALNELGRPDAAVESHDKAIELRPDFVEAYYNRGNALRDLGRLDEAVASYDRAIAMKPEYADAYVNRCVTLQELGRLDEAAGSHERAPALRPEFAFPARLLLPIIPASRADIDEWRDRYRAGIETLNAEPITLQDPTESNMGSFYLAYHDMDDRPVMESLCRLFRAKAPGLNFTAPHLADWRPPAAGSRRIRVGFLSQFLVDHTIGKLYQGFLRHLDRARFEVVLIHARKARPDAFREHLDGLADKVLVLPGDFAAQQQRVAAEALDVLFYPDIGMSQITYFLAYARLAPVQAVSWGHPDTTGLDSMDYFVSADAIEPEGADALYSERLIRLKRLPCFYQALIKPTEIPARAALGLPERGTLYGCPQSLFKFHPDFDAVLARIAADDPEGHIVLIEAKVSAWTRLLKERWAARHPILLERVVFLPRQPLDRFMSLMAHLDVLLDPVHFGSGNTLYEAMVYGTPIVTWAGRFMRGRIVAGAYRQMGIEAAPIAERIEEYAPLAVALGRDAGRREALQRALREKAPLLYADLAAVREFEQFLEAAVTAAGHGERLPSDGAGRH